MLTKKQYALSILYKFREERFGVNTYEPIKDFSLYEKYVLESSNVGIALEYLGELKDPEMLEYISCRGGHVQSLLERETGKVYTLTMRELMELLPD